MVDRVDVAERPQQEVQDRLVGEHGDRGGHEEGDDADDHPVAQLAQVLAQRHVVGRRAIPALRPEREGDHVRPISSDWGRPARSRPVTSGSGRAPGGVDVTSGEGAAVPARSSASGGRHVPSARFDRRPVGPPTDPFVTRRRAGPVRRGRAVGRHDVGRRRRRRRRRRLVAVVSVGVSSGPMFERWSSRAEGERASRAISVVEGRSGMVLRTSVSIRWRNSLKERQAPPT